MGYVLKDNHIEFWNLLDFCLKCKLRVREIKYILWKFACNKTYREIAKLDGINHHQSVDQVITAAKKKIIKYNPYIDR